jgi:hypothetical protein
MSNRRHILSMAFTGVVILGGLWVAGVPLEGAVPWALLLACPLMMAAMMPFMDHDRSHGAGHTCGFADQDGAEAAPGDDVRRNEVQYRR